ncbi:hypothetical protein EJB05_01161, partial [Eragrostis curvula]
MPATKRALEQGGGGGGGAGGAGSSGEGGAPQSPSSVLKKRCRSFDLEIRGCRHLQELAASCVQSVQVSVDAAVQSAVTRNTR